ncbi:Stp1/IreP family PP2C-type Ser/Thr phosphatase [uncultured Pseudoflavonifractor sp.]|uniref:Stp1/IreP family PP2C-type Ser/Thr phosphatase n=1 Tax=uncultured Pseudoflavonifractor sp. TaxID=1221379 RepID=UPI0025EDB6EB|nr:Stp1/IreP family PP2C-type Ser/Thr phosphatase [uncultured Pseudoflavonifractor sp.]
MIKAWGITDRGAVRHQNQDAYYLDVPGNLALAVVCDGMGGAKAGNVASTLAVDTFVEALRSGSIDAQEPDDALARAAEQANRAVFDRAVSDPACQGMGTTMVAVLLTDRSAHILNIGDSRCYLVTETGISRVTRDHSVVEDLVQKGRITPEEARLHPRKNLITRALGAEERVRADLYHLDLAVGDCLLLCSDGLSNIVTDQELLYEIIHGGEKEDCCRRLLDIAMSRGAPDNVTAVLIQV